MGIFRSTNLPLEKGRDTSENCSLSNQINTATRLTHTQLNRLIIARLPLALPPHASDPASYLTGLIHIAPIYITFELLWDALLVSSGHLPTQDCFDEDSDHSDNDNPQHEHHAELNSRMKSILSNLQLPGLLRSQRLRSDLETLSGKSENQVEQELQDISRKGKLSEFLNHITKSVIKRPHVLLAYAWVLYMALFSGGRYMRASLERAGPEFWSRLGRGEESTSKRINKPLDDKARVAAHLQFFNFIGGEDGEDIKRDFKTRFAWAETLLNNAERNDIVLEAEHIFTLMGEIVRQLDEACNSEGLGTNSIANKSAQRVAEIGICSKKSFACGIFVVGSVMAVIALALLFQVALNESLQVWVSSCRHLNELSRNIIDAASPLL